MSDDIFCRHALSCFVHMEKKEGENHIDRSLISFSDLFFILFKYMSWNSAVFLSPLIVAIVANNG